MARAKSNNDTALLVLTLLTAVFVFGIVFKECGKTTYIAPDKTDSLQTVIEIQQGKADSLKAIIEDLLIDREVKLIEVVKIRNKYIHDTVTLKHYDTACPELVAENSLLWEIVKDDSVVINSCGQVVRHQDSVIKAQDEVITIQTDKVSELKKELSREQKKALRNARLLKVVGVLGLVGWLL